MNQILETIFTFLLLVAISIAFVGYLWSTIKPTVEKAELQYIKDNNAALE